MTACSTVYELFADAAKRRPDRIALVDETLYGRGAALTYTELDTASRELSAGLHALGLRRGDAIALLLPSCAEWVMTFLAAARLGLLVVPLNTRYRGAELLHLLRVSRAKALVVAPRFESVDLAGRLVDVWPRRESLELRWLVPVHATTVPGAPDALATVPLEDLRRPVADSIAPCGEPADPVIVFGTSGTTSAPKLAVHTQQTVTRHISEVAAVVDLTESDVALSVLPLNGTFGFVPFAAGLSAGTTQVLLPVHDLDRTVEALARHSITFLTCAEGPLREVLADPRVAAGQAGRLRRIVTAGVAIEDIVAAADARGIRAVNVYGSSELFAFAATWDFAAPPGSRAVAGGRLIPSGLSVRAADVDTGEPLPDGCEGELQFRGPTLFTGYLANPEATSRAFTADGWYRSGDRGRTLPDRILEYHSRLGDAMRVKGYLVNPADIETCLMAHPAVEFAQLVGVREPHTGDDQPIAFVRISPGASARPDDLIEHCRQLLAGFKVPVRVIALAEFPTTPSANGDKIRKDRLREMAAALLAAPEQENP
ncbi:AMP-binding protein [Nonomuraea insulae]|uniref:Long-chain-fatty-acid--CoA ligase n=1 Tax=Nonomuraea insulae TaxID=1616787 RepID=A0ABW1CYP0_9ACTN